MNLAAVLFFGLGLGVWFGLVGQAAPTDVALGALVVASAWGLLQRASAPRLVIGPRRWRAWVFGVGRYLFGHVSLEVVRSTLRVFGKVVRPTLHLSPAIVAVEVPGVTRAGLILLAYGIALTPGELIVDVDEDRGVLYVHAIDAPDPDALRARILGVYERYIKEATQW